MLVVAAGPPRLLQAAHLARLGVGVEASTEVVQVRAEDDAVEVAVRLPSVATERMRMRICCAVSLADAAASAQVPAGSNLRGR